MSRAGANTPNQPDSFSLAASSDFSSTVNLSNSRYAHGSQENLLAQQATYVNSWSAPIQSRSDEFGSNAPESAVQLWDDNSQEEMDTSEIVEAVLSLEDTYNQCEAEAMDVQDLHVISDRRIWFVPTNRVRLGAEIGRGWCGIVVSGTMTRFEGDETQAVAVKTIQRSAGSSLAEEMKRLADLENEFNILRQLNHKNIIKLFGYNGEARQLILEHLPLGGLLSHIRNLARREDLAVAPLAKYALDMAEGMEYLESLRIVHRDLALRNVLLASISEVKICDFGLARELGADNDCKVETERNLPFNWYPPETIANLIFTSKSDVWSYGVTLWEMYSGGDFPDYPGKKCDLAETVKLVRLARPEDCPRDIYNLMLSCWQLEPEERITFTQLRQTLESTYGEAPMAAHW